MHHNNIIIFLLYTYLIIIFLLFKILTLCKQINCIQYNRDSWICYSWLLIAPHVTFDSLEGFSS